MIEILRGALFPVFGLVVAASVPLTAMYLFAGMTPNEIYYLLVYH